MPGDGEADTARRRRQAAAVEQAQPDLMLAEVSRAKARLRAFAGGCIGFHCDVPFWAVWLPSCFLETKTPGFIGRAFFPSGTSGQNELDSYISHFLPQVVLNIRPPIFRTVTSS
jgi:hypothetical protein